MTALIRRFFTIEDKILSFGFVSLQLSEPVPGT